MNARKRRQRLQDWSDRIKADLVKEKKRNRKAKAKS